MTSEEKRRASYQNGHGESDQSFSPLSAILDVFLLLFFLPLSGFWHFH